MPAVEHLTYSFNGFTLDTARGCLMRGREEVRLRPKSYSALIYLLENSGRLVSKDELVLALWPDTAVTDNSLVHCIKEVRAALGDSSQTHIRTVPRRGYIFEKKVVAGPERKASNGGNGNGLSGIRSVAILPLRPLNGSDGDEYLGLGIADTLITRLSGTNSLVVRPTSSVQRYTFDEPDTVNAGREQRVDAVMEGSLQRYGDRIRVTVRLISTKDGSTLWAYKNDEAFGDIFELQDAVSEKMADALSVQMNRGGASKSGSTDNSEAYTLYMKGVFLRGQMTEDSLRKSVDCFRKAAELDPDYALACCGEASSNSPLAFLGHLPVRDAEARNRNLIKRALELDHGLAEAHAAFGEFKLFIEWDWDGAEDEFQRALALDPREQLTHLLYPDLLLMKDRADEAIAMTRAALERDPLSPRVGKALAWMYHLAGQYENAIAQAHATRELFPNYHLVSMGPSYERMGMHDEAIAAYLETEAHEGLAGEQIAHLRRSYDSSGWAGYWQDRLALAIASGSSSPVFLASLYARVGENSAALDHLEQAIRDREMSLIFLGIDPAWRSLHSEPRFRDLLRLMRLDAGA